MDYLLSRELRCLAIEKSLPELGRSFGKLSLLTKLALRGKTKFKQILRKIDVVLHNQIVKSKILRISGVFFIVKLAPRRISKLAFIMNI